MTAALLGTLTGLTLSTALVGYVRAGVSTPAPRTGRVADWIAAALDDHTWRDEQLHHAIQHHWLRESLAYLATAGPVHAALYQRAPEAPGLAIVAQWWQPIGRPPMTARRTPGATLIGAAA